MNSSTMNSVQLQQKERTAQFLWTMLILMFFMIQAVIWTVAISATARDSSHAVVAGYGEQAFLWDEMKDKKNASEALGWTLELAVDPRGDIRGSRVVTLSLSDRNNKPIENAHVKLKAFHRGQAAEVQTISLLQVGPGVYSGRVKIQRAGRWQLSGTATAPEAQFFIDQEIQLTLGNN